MTPRSAGRKMTVGARQYQRRGGAACWHRQATYGSGLGWLPVHDLATALLLDEIERLRTLCAQLEDRDRWSPVDGHPHRYSDEVDE